MSYSAPAVLEAIPARERSSDSIRCTGVSLEKRSAPPIVRKLSRLSPNDSIGNREALYAEFAPLIRRLIRQYGQDTEMRQDLTGEIYCRFDALLDAYDPRRGVPLRPYLVRQLSAVVYTYARHQWRLRKREVTWEPGEGYGEPIGVYDPTPGWLTALSEQQTLAGLPHAIQKLPTRQRQVVLWRYYEERSFEEIAQRLDIQAATARSLLRHGLNNLRKQIHRPGVDAE